MNFISNVKCLCLILTMTGTALPVLARDQDNADDLVISAGDDDLDQNEVLKNQIKRLNGRLEEMERELSLLRKGNSLAQSPSPELPASERLTDESMGDDPTAVNPMPTTAEDEAQVDAILAILSDKPEAKEDEKEETKKTPAKARETAKEAVAQKREKATEKAEKSPTPTLDVGDETAQYNAAQAFYKHGEYAQAERAFVDFMTRFPKSKMVKSAKFWQAKSLLNQADPKSNKAISTANKQKAGEAVKAFAEFYKGYSKDANVPEALLGMGKAFALQDDKKKACVPLKKLKADYPKAKEHVTSADKLIKEYACDK